MIRWLMRFELIRRLVCKHPRLECYRRGFLGERKPWEDAIAMWCPDCKTIVWRKELE